jgi:hypothetical protein
VSVATRPVQGRFDAYTLSGEPLEVPGSARLYRILERPEILYKELGQPLLGDAEATRIRRLVEVGAAVAKDHSAGARKHLAWPLDEVIEEGAVVGVITPYAGDSYYRPAPGETLMPRNLNYLRLPKEEVPPEVRFVLLRQLARVLALLEYAKLVHGDISAQNVLWRTDPEPSIFLIDCDGMHDTGEEGSRATTDGWTDPRKEAAEIESHDMRSDWLALALAVWRVTALEKGIPPRTQSGVELPPGIPADLRGLLRRSFDDTMDADARPAPAEWAKSLDAVLRETTEVRRRRPAPRPSPSEQPSTPIPTGRRKRLLSPLRVLILVPFLALAALIASGFMEPESHPGQLHAQVATERWARTYMPVSGLRATCPPDSSLDRGARYLCRVENGAGAVAHVRVKVGPDGVVTRRLKIVAYRGRAFAADLRRLYRRRHENGLSYAIDHLHCPQTVSARPGTEFRCGARFTDGAVGELRVVLHDRSGAYSWREVGASPHGQGVALR